MKVTASANWPELGSIENNVWVLGLRLSPGWSLCTLYLSLAMWSYRRRFGSLWLCACSICDVNCSSVITSYCLLILQNRSSLKKFNFFWWLLFSKTQNTIILTHAVCRSIPVKLWQGGQLWLGNHRFWSTCPETNTPEPNPNTQRLKKPLFNQD